MKTVGKILLFIWIGVTSCCYAQQRPPQEFKGLWWLSMVESANLPLNLTFVNDSTLVPVLYSPMQSPEAIKPDKWSFINDTLAFSNKKLNLKLTLSWNAVDSTFSGILKQGLMKSRILFSPSDGLFVMNRPQTPMPPYPYEQTEFTVVRKKANVTLTGTLTIPSGNGPFPAVVLVSGSGQQNRDEELLGHKPFLVLADYLTRHGIAVARYDDRSTGGSKGDVVNATSFDFADDAEAVFKWLRKQKNIRSDRVGIIGHSEGALIACIVAARNNKVDFVVSLCGQGGSGSDILVDQNKLLLEASGIDTALVAVRVHFLKELFSMIDDVEKDDLEKVVVKLMEDKASHLDKEARGAISMRRADAALFASTMSMPWMYTFVNIDNSIYLKQLKCPLLAVGGTKDLQVPCSNLDLISKHTGNHADIRLFPDLNHLMQHCSTGLPNEYMLIEETVSEEVLATVADWILKITSGNK